ARTAPPVSLRLATRPLPSPAPHLPPRLPALRRPLDPLRATGAGCHPSPPPPPTDEGDIMTTASAPLDRLDADELPAATRRFRPLWSTVALVLGVCLAIASLGVRPVTHDRIVPLAGSGGDTAGVDPSLSDVTGGDGSV